MRFSKIKHFRVSKDHASLRLCADLPEPLLHTKPVHGGNSDRTDLIDAYTMPLRISDTYQISMCQRY